MIEKEVLEKERQYIQTLIDNEQIELKKLEFKRDLPGQSSDEKKEFLADVTSFANTQGGDLVLGIDQEEGTGKPIYKGISNNDIDSTIQRIESIIRDGVDPRIVGISIISVPFDDSSLVLIIRIPNSWIGPHRVEFRGHFKFYARNSNGKYPMDVDELRVAFNLSATIVERMRDFRLQRISKISVNETPVPFWDSPRVVFHFIPMDSLLSPKSYDIKYFFDLPTELHPMRATSWFHSYNLDGVITYAGPGSSQGSHSYVQLYRNGIIEAVEGSMLSNEEKKLVYTTTLVEESVLSFKRFFDVYKKLGIDPKIVFYMTLVGVKGFSIPHTEFPDFIGEIHNIDRDIIFLPEIVIEDYDISPEKILKPNFDLLWNACGFPGCPLYDKDEKLNLKK